MRFDENIGVGEIDKVKSYLDSLEDAPSVNGKKYSKEAQSATPQIEEHGDANDSYGRKLGMRVQVTPDDSGRDPVVGELASLTTYEVVIKRSDPQVGDVAVHFPRAGFIIQPAP